MKMITLTALGRHGEVTPGYTLLYSHLFALILKRIIFIVNINIF